MRRALAALCVLTALSSAAAALGANAATSFRAGRWELTAGGVTRSVRPGGVFHHCASRPIIAIRLEGFARGAQSGETFQAGWTVNGRQRDLFPYRWGESGSYTTSFLVESLNGLPDGVWRFSLISGASGASRLRIRSRRGC